MLNRYFKASAENADFIFANIAVKNIYFALISLDYVLNRPDYDIAIYHDEHTYYFFHIQSLLTACGNIANVFYNNGFNGRKATERCQRLRSKLQICKKDFPLVFQKEVRNTNEHFDERYEEFDNCIGDYNILDKDTDPFIRAVVTTNPHLRTYDREHRQYITFNRKKERIIYDLPALQEELWRMLARITGSEAFTSGWEESMPTEELK